MITVETIGELRSQLDAVRRKGTKVSFVPTMGALHRGHLSLVDIARTRGEFVVLSIFVNPIQFNSPEDLQKYPRPLERDMDQAASVGVDLLFIPRLDEIFPNFNVSGEQIKDCRVTAGSAGARWEGPFRPGHFDGVATIVAQLFNMVQPNAAVFGEKDFQQLRVIEQMARDLKFPIQIVPGPTVRDQDGLALSSRNERLTAEMRERALSISKALFASADRLRCGMQNARMLESEARLLMEQSGLDVEYVACVDCETLEPLNEVESAAQILIAAFVDGVRLIDNLRVER